MANRSQLLALSILLGIAITAGGCKQCDIPVSEANRIVLKELARQGLDPKFLSGPTKAPGSCSVDFEYEGKGTKISYVVADDPIHGLELHSWDYAADQNGP